MVSVHARNHVVLQGVVDPSGESVSVQCGDSYIHLLNKGGSVRVEVVSGGAMLLHAAGHLQLEGDSIQIKAKGGVVRFSDVVTSSTGKLTTPKKTSGKSVTKGKGRSHNRAAHNKNHHGIYRTMHGSVAGSPVLHGINREAYARAIAQKESSGNYQDSGIFVQRKHESGYALGAYRFMSYRSDVEQIVRQKPDGADFLARCAQGIKPQPDEVTKFFTPDEQEQLFSQDSQNLIDRAAREMDPPTGQPFTDGRLVERAAQMHFAGPGSYMDGHERDGNNTSIVGYGRKVLSFYKLAAARVHSAGKLLLGMAL